jgi:prepilin-type N-terminal cleavage/methylation domain
MVHQIKRRTNEEKGFTLIELLVVILIIGILAAIAIPSFLNQRGKATDAKYKSAARTAQTAMETYFTDKNTYVGATPAALQAIEPTLSDATSFTLTVPAVTLSTYTVTATNPTDATDTFSITRTAGGAVTRSCGAGAKACNSLTW